MVTNLKEICKNIITAFVLLFLVVCGILTLTGKDKEYSEEENRYLAQKPELTKETLFKGSYQTELEEYLTDQFVLRTDFMKAYALCERTLGKTDYNGVYVCDDNWLIEVYNEPESTDYVTGKLSKVAEKTDAHCMLMLVPTAISIYEDVLPAGASETNRQKEVKDYIYANCGMDTIDVWDDLLKASAYTQIYYKTDHHWTTQGAYVAYKTFCEVEGLKTQSEKDFDIENVSNEFYGTVYSKALNPFQPADTITAFKQDMTGITVTYQSGEGELYNDAYLSVKDKYSYFLNGIQPIITIENSNVSNGKTLLVVKDSYANCFVPFLINHYEKIVVLDTRYYRNGVTSTAEEIGATDILFLFNLNTLDTETAIAGIY